MIRLPVADQLIGRVPVLWRALAAILILGGLILMLVQSRARILSAGTEVKLATAPVDPRDLFRGDYVILNYKISTLDPAALDGEKALHRNQTVYVRLAPAADGFAEARGIYLARPTTAAGESVIEGRVTSTGSCLAGADGEPDCDLGTRAIRVAYGLESYFVPQGTGGAIERTERKRIEIIAAIAPSGQAAIKRLLIDGKLVHREPPY
ncbi:GDYXXLXY domain-containing protein [Bosea sp. (in: a-proteobacteria)]|uniref:GDYXXLXY domain-containing protein n=1 Tax=Bosea sp. (in: a-proteobacteria) TaxID=1871050 RepID=UPI002FCA3560